MEKLSVIICTYNPDNFIFGKCLEAIFSANKLYRPFEIIIVDNGSAPALSQQPYVQAFVKQNDNIKIAVETKQGLTPARLRGIKESTGDILVFIDDDNWIQPDFFSAAMKLAAANPHIGSWSGQVKLLFEKEPEAWTRKYWGLLVYREFEEDKWSNLPHLPETMPCGAGLFVKKTVADHYYSLHEKGKRQVQLDRTGHSLFSAGDNDLAACACDIGLGVGLFHDLLLYHYIPEKRVAKEYLLKLAEGIAASSVVFRSFRGEYAESLTTKNKIANFLRLMMKSGIEKQFFKAVLKGTQTGRDLVNLS